MLAVSGTGIRERMLCFSSLTMWCSGTSRMVAREIPARAAVHHSSFVKAHTDVVSECATATMEGAAEASVRARAPAPTELGQERPMMAVEVNHAMTVLPLAKVKETKESANKQAEAAVIVAISMTWIRSWTGG